MMWNGAMSGWGWLMMVLWIVFGIAVLVLLVMAIIWLARNLTPGTAALEDRRGQAQGSPTAREALDLRYARGEIDRDRYLAARRDLEDGSG